MEPQQINVGEPFSIDKEELKKRVCEHIDDIFDNHIPKGYSIFTLFDLGEEGLFTDTQICGMSYEHMILGITHILGSIAEQNPLAAEIGMKKVELHMLMKQIMEQEEVKEEESEEVNKMYG